MCFWEDRYLHVTQNQQVSRSHSLIWYDIKGSSVVIGGTYFRYKQRQRSSLHESCNYNNLHPARRQNLVSYKITEIQHQHFLRISHGSNSTFGKDRLFYHLFGDTLTPDLIYFFRVVIFSLAR